VSARFSRGQKPFEKLEAGARLIESFSLIKDEVVGFLEEYQKKFARLQATSVLFFVRSRPEGWRPPPYIVNLGVFRTGRLSAAIGS
jgi:hypothetical protein